MNLNQVYIRGNALDYDRWEREGAKGERYRVTHHVYSNLPLTLKQKFCFSVRPMY